MLAITALEAGYGGKPVVHLPNLTLPQGEHCLLLGKSGSGKTTLLYAIAGLLKPLAGSITLAGTTMNSLHGAKADQFRGQHIGIIYQTLHMVASLSVLENLLLVQYAAGQPQDPAAAMALLTRLGLGEHAHKKPSALSQGQQQRVAIARAAITKPKLILGDEPTSALDDDACESVMHLLHDLAQQTGASLILATHDARIKKHFTHTITLGDAA